MKLVFTYCWGDEGCSGTDYIPFEDSDVDTACQRFLDLAEETRVSGHNTFQFLGAFHTVSDYIMKKKYTPELQVFLPEIQELDQWWSAHCVR